MYFWENERVYLRVMDEEDTESIQEHLLDTKSRMQSDHGIALPTKGQTAKDMVAYAMECTREGDELWFGIYNLKEQMVGYAVISYMNERHGNAQCHMNIFQEFKKQGYATAAARILLSYLFDERRFYKVGFCILEGNKAGFQFAKSLGFSLDAFRDDMFYTQGKYLGEYYFSMLLPEYRRLRNCDFFASELLFDEREQETGRDAHRAYGENGILSVRELDPKRSFPVSRLGELPQGVVQDGKIVKKPANPGAYRPYFWKYDGIELREMTETEYLINHEMIYDTKACVLYDCDVKLPMVENDLSEQEKAHLYFASDDDRLEFAIYNEDEEYVGNINLCGLDRKNGKFSYSIYVLEEHRQNAYGTKALRLLLWYCFEELRMHKMICLVNDGNIGSAMVMRKVGCRVEGISRSEQYYHGEYVDAVMFGVTREEFLQFHQFV